MPPAKLARGIDIAVTHDVCVWTRIFLLFRAVTDEEMTDFVNSGRDKVGAIQMNWRELIGWQEQSKDKSQFRVFELSVLECS